MQEVGAKGRGLSELEGHCEQGLRLEELEPPSRQVCWGSAFKGCTKRGCAEHSCSGRRGRNQAGSSWGPRPCSLQLQQSLPHGPGPHPTTVTSVTLSRTHAASYCCLSVFSSDRLRDLASFTRAGPQLPQAFWRSNWTTSMKSFSSAYHLTQQFCFWEFILKTL